MQWPAHRASQAEIRFRLTRSSGVRACGRVFGARSHITLHIAVQRRRDLCDHCLPRLSRYMALRLFHRLQPQSSESVYSWSAAVDMRIAVGYQVQSHWGCESVRLKTFKVWLMDSGHSWQSSPEYMYALLSYRATPGWKKGGRFESKRTFGAALVFINAVLYFRGHATYRPAVPHTYVLHLSFVAFQDKLRPRPSPFRAAWYNSSSAIAQRNTQSAKTKARMLVIINSKQLIVDSANI